MTDKNTTTPAASVPAGGEVLAERQRCADICLSRFRSLSADGNHTAANEAHKCASAVLYASLGTQPPTPQDAAPVAGMVQIGEGIFLPDGTWSGSASRQTGYLSMVEDDEENGCSIRPIYAATPPAGPAGTDGSGT